MRWLARLGMKIKARILGPVLLAFTASPDAWKYWTMSICAVIVLALMVVWGITQRREDAKERPPVRIRRRRYRRKGPS